ncbi:efflux RND transporter permease subunit [Gimesia maris]|uniref:efflux RND transporter permease subunit n=1 Tax=Gimesia maris TaxID=122 RepID=UPI00241D5C48|nr:MMPL family transporter [Gimesia maris]|tara:strand:- start:31000 stop:33225 length:2226 start_codon:yes stop_codon:yes gene_type:complete
MMISSFYNKYSRQLIWGVFCTLPILTFLAELLPSNNDIETWLPKDSDVRIVYDRFKAEFGAEEVVLVAVQEGLDRPLLVEATASRIESLPTVRQCWTPQRLKSILHEFKVEPAEIDNRLNGLLMNSEKNVAGILVLLSDIGIRNRAGTVQGIREKLEYNQLTGNEVQLAGAPVVIAELDRLGSQKSNKKFFIITLLISLCLLYYSFREWKKTLATLGLTIWAINLTTALIYLGGGEMNFILGALSVMVMVFTLAISIHVHHYVASCIDEPDPLAVALKIAWKPCVLATLTTTIGLFSLTVSEIGPVIQFGYAASVGTFVSLITGLGLTPAVLTLWPIDPKMVHSGGKRWNFQHCANWLIDHSGRVSIATIILVMTTGVGLFSLRTKIDPLDFLPAEGRVIQDVRAVQNNLTELDSIEAIVDFGDEEIPFIKKVEHIRKLEAIIQQHPAVRHTMSLASFFPKQFPESPFETARLLSHAQSAHGDNDFTSDGERLWRISARISSDADLPQDQVYDELAVMIDDPNVILTGVAPLLRRAQNQIFTGFWESFSMAFVIITIVMIVSLRSIKAGLVAMVPNLTPICIVFGILGWYQIPIDIGIMMTASIALGIAVDGTFHFLVRYQSQFRLTRNSAQASRDSLLMTGEPIFTAAVITGAGMLALTLSNFVPTARFGYMMTSLLVAALVGDLVLLPCLLALRPKKSDDHNESDHTDSGQSSHDQQHTPHFLKQHQHGAKDQSGKAVA